MATTVKLREAIAVLARARSGAHGPKELQEAGLLLRSVVVSLSRSLRGAREAEREDLVGETLGVVLERGGAEVFDSDGAAKAWLRRVQRNRFVDLRRRSKRRKTQEFSAVAAPDQQEPDRRIGRDEGSQHSAILDSPEQLRDQVCADLRRVARDCDTAESRRAKVAGTVEDLIALYVTQAADMGDLVAREREAGAEGSDTKLRNRLEKRQSRAREALHATLVHEHCAQTEGPKCVSCATPLRQDRCSFCSANLDEDLRTQDSVAGLYEDAERVRRLVVVIERLKGLWQSELRAG